VFTITEDWIVFYLFFINVNLSTTIHNKKIDFIFGWLKLRVNFDYHNNLNDCIHNKNVTPDILH